MMATLRCGCSMPVTGAGALALPPPHAATRVARHSPSVKRRMASRVIGSVSLGLRQLFVTAGAHIGPDRAGAQLVQVVDDVLVAHHLRPFVALLVHDLLQFAAVAAGERLLW